MLVHFGDTVLPSGTDDVFFFFNVTGVYLTSRTITDPTKGGAIVMTKKEGKYVTHLSPRTNTYLGILYARQF